MINRATYLIIKLYTFKISRDISFFATCILQNMIRTSIKSNRSIRVAKNDNNHAFIKNKSTRKIFNLWKKIALNAFINHDSKGEIYFVEIPFELWGGLITSHRFGGERSSDEFARGITIGHSDKSNLTDNR